MIGLIGSGDECEESDTHDRGDDDEIDRYTKNPKSQIRVYETIENKQDSADRYILGVSDI
jgi:hypothetical protein